MRGPPPRVSSAPRSAEITSPVCAVAAVARAAPVLRRRTQRRRAELGGLRRRDGARAVGRMGPNVGLVIILNAPQIRAAAIRANVEHDDPCGPRRQRERLSISSHDELRREVLPCRFEEVANAHTHIVHLVAQPR